jgi:hypothetical protein
MSLLGKSTFAKMFEAAELCRQRALDVPMLVLIYTAMDTLAWALYGDNVKGVRERFTALCDTYILPGSLIESTALELYAARCSVLHTLGWESNLSNSGKARAVFYSFGNDDPTLAQAALELTNPGQFVSVRADDLLAAVQSAVTTVAVQAEGDRDLALRLTNDAGKQYRSIESHDADKMFGAFIEMKTRKDEQSQ